MSFKICANPLDIDIEGEDGATWGIQINGSGSLLLYSISASYLDQDNRDAWDQVKIDVTPEQAGDVIAALTAWFEQLPTQTKEP